MISKTIIDYLNSVDELNASAFAEVPEEAPDKYIIVEHISGDEKNHICTTRLAVKSIAPSLYEAALLNEAVKKAVSGAVSLNEVCAIDLNNDFNDTDTARKKYRYQAVFDITHY